MKLGFQHNASIMQISCLKLRVALPSFVLQTLRSILVFWHKINLKIETWILSSWDSHYITNYDQGVSNYFHSTNNIHNTFFRIKHFSIASGDCVWSKLHPFKCVWFVMVTVTNCNICYYPGQKYNNILLIYIALFIDMDY